MRWGASVIFDIFLKYFFFSAIDPKCWDALKTKLIKQLDDGHWKVCCCSDWKYTSFISPELLSAMNLSTSKQSNNEIEKIHCHAILTSNILGPDYQCLGCFWFPILVATKHSHLQTYKLVKFYENSLSTLEASPDNLYSDSDLSTSDWIPLPPHTTSKENLKEL